MGDKPTKTHGSHMADKPEDKGKELANLELRMEARMQRLTEEFNQQMCSIHQQVEDPYVANNTKLDQLLAAF